MEDLPIGSEIVLKVVKTEKEQCNGCFFDENVTISMRMFAEILTVAQALEKTERLFNLKE